MAYALRRSALVAAATFASVLTAFAPAAHAAGEAKACVDAATQYQALGLWLAGMIGACAALSYWIRALAGARAEAR